MSPIVPLRPRAAATVLTTLVLIALAVALLGPMWRVPADDPEVIALVDVSESVDPGALASQLADLEDVSLAGLVAFADHPITIQRVDELRSIRVRAAGVGPDAQASGAPTIHRGSTDLASALELAAGSFETDRPHRILVLSDGAENRGNAFATLPRLIEAGVEVHSRRLPARHDRARLLTVGANPPIRAGEPTRLAVTLLNPSDQATLTLELDGRILHRQPIAPSQETTVHHADVSFDEPGDQRLTARLSIADQVVHEVQSTVSVGPRRRLLLVADANVRPLARALEELGWSTTVRPASGLPTTPEGYRAWDALLLDDLDARLLEGVRMEAIRDWVVELGGGLLFASGPSTYGEEGYTDSPLEAILPMRFNVEEEKTEVALMIALDKSYSMRGEKIELAKEAAKAVVRELDPEHRFGVVSFDWNPFKVVPLQLIGDGGDIVERIGRIEASAQTNFYPALEMCQEQLVAVEAEVKHVILLSDGKTYPDEYEKLIAEMRDNEITVSTVAVGSEADRELLAQIAEWGDGTSYFVQDATKVQSILLDEARSKTEQTLVEETVPVRLVGASPVLDGVDAASAPPLLGRVNLEAAEIAEVLLDTENDRPLLASRSVGLGRTWMTAFDLDGRWTGSWTSWAGFARLVSQVLRDAARSQPPSRSLRLEDRGDHARAVFEAYTDEGTWENGLEATLALSRRHADGSTEAIPSVPLRQVAPGRYLADAPVELAGGDELIAEVLEGTTTGGAPRATAALLRAVAPEERPSSERSIALLRDLATATGGTTSGPLAGVLEASAGQARRPRALWPALATLALVVYLLELALRRSGLLRRLTAGARPR